jgi:hypothetical protein
MSVTMHQSISHRLVPNLLVLPSGMAVFTTKMVSILKLLISTRRLPRALRDSPEALNTSRTNLSFTRKRNTS